MNPTSYNPDTVQVGQRWQHSPRHGSEIVTVTEVGSAGARVEWASGKAYVVSFRYFADLTLLDDEAPTGPTFTDEERAAALVAMAKVMITELRSVDYPDIMIEAAAEALGVVNSGDPRAETPEAEARGEAAFELSNAMAENVIATVELAIRTAGQVPTDWQPTLH